MKLQFQLLHNISSKCLQLFQLRRCRVWVYMPPSLFRGRSSFMVVSAQYSSSSLCLCLHPILIQFELPPYFSICSRDQRAYMYLLYGWQLLGMVPIRVDSTICKHNQTYTVSTSMKSTSMNCSVIGIKLVLVEFVISKFALVEFSLCATQLV